MFRQLITTTAMVFFSSLVSASINSVEVWKSPSCGCCTKWVSHLEDNGFNVISHNVKNIETIKSDFNIPKKLRSCHTAKIGNFIIEGHVPSSDINKLLKSADSNIKILSVPGMPVGSPGMIMGSKFQPFPVVSVKDNGDMTIFSYHKKLEK